MSVDTGHVWLDAIVHRTRLVRCQYYTGHVWLDASAHLTCLVRCQYYTGHVWLDASAHRKRLAWLSASDWVSVTL